MTSQLEEGELFTETTPDHGLWVKEISEVLPRRRFLYILRDRRDVTASLHAAS